MKDARLVNPGEIEGLCFLKRRVGIFRKVGKQKGKSKKAKRKINKTASFT
jgi:hypothetical protein